MHAMYECMCVCMRCMNTCMHVYACMYIYVCHVYMNACMYVYMNACMYECMYIYACMHAYMSTSRLLCAMSSEDAMSQLILRRQLRSWGQLVMWSQQMLSICSWCCASNWHCVGNSAAQLTDVLWPTDAARTGDGLRPAHERRSGLCQDTPANVQNTQC